ncbi:DUF257 family protein [Thermococcus sp.]
MAVVNSIRRDSMGHEQLEKILAGIKAGETVLIEYEPVSSPELLLHFMVRYCGKNGRELIIDDLADTLVEFMTRLKLKGVPVQHLEKASVMKIGGYRNVGKIINTIELDKYTLDFKYYGKVYDRWRAGKDTLFNPVLGIYKVFLMSEHTEAIRLVRNISTFVGNTTRIAFYFINRETIKNRNPDAFSLLEEIATSILSWERRCDSVVLRVVKSANEEICGSTAEVPVEDIIGY